MGIVEVTYLPVKCRVPFLNYVFESIGDTQLSVHNDDRASSPSEPCRLYDLLMTSCRNGTEIVSVVLQRRRRYLLRECPVRGIGKHLYRSIQTLTCQNEYYLQYRYDKEQAHKYRQGILRDARKLRIKPVKSLSRLELFFPRFVVFDLLA